MPAGATALAHAQTDGVDHLIVADAPLAALQVQCGGDVPGPIAVPALLELVRKARRYGLRLARPMTATTGDEIISAWVEVVPSADDTGCAIAVRNWQVTPLPPEDVSAIARRRTRIDRQLAELTAWLDADQHLLTIDCDARDLADVARAMRSGAGQHWTEFVAVEGANQDQTLHWRLLDGARLEVPGSDRNWRATLVPREVPGGEPSGFELYFTADEPLPVCVVPPAGAAGADVGQRLVGRELAPVLRQPIARIIANAETIRTRLAGPLAEEYSSYAADIASAGQHLLALIDDLADLEVVESQDFATAPDHIDLGDVARRAAGILGVRARERGIAIEAPRTGDALPAIAEFRRVLQILLNLVGNAIRYSPANSQVWLRLDAVGNRARIVVADQGSGLSDEQQTRVFEKFERLGRSDEGGSGLGLYISRRLARAMGGDLTVESAPGQGARFILDLPGS